MLRSLVGSEMCIRDSPYSGDHIPKLLNFLSGSERPWVALCPNYVYTKPYYEPAFKQAPSKPFFLTPPGRYVYHTPKGMRQVNSHALQTAPFVSMWYCGFGAVTGELIKWWKRDSEVWESEGVKIARAKKHLPQNMMGSYDPNRRRRRKKQREAAARKLRKQKKLAAQAGS
eukprot:TRINITY_DN20881_c0_g2_i1.p1 TRINITY_DN20881_c0_g2~~TRINITY_DN20881_c0_g2_i1.p1  ORF type:complete len:171 (+),score=37.44 TRINITY_DN20881_c0_g2_i1:119-631(+)